MPETTEKVKKKGFFQGLKSEFKKIVWPTTPELVKQTILVIAISLILCVLITTIDSLALDGINLLVK